MDTTTKTADYYKAHYPRMVAAHEAACMLPGSTGGNGGPKDEEDKNLFTDSSGTVWNARAYNLTQEAALEREALKPRPASGAVFGGTATA